MFTIHVTIQGLSLGLHSANDFGFMQSLAFGMLSAGCEVEWLSEAEAAVL